MSPFTVIMIILVINMIVYGYVIFRKDSSNNNKNK